MKLGNLLYKTQQKETLSLKITLKTCRELDDPYGSLPTRDILCFYDPG